MYLTWLHDAKMADRSEFVATNAAPLGYTACSWEMTGADLELGLQLELGLELGLELELELWLEQMCVKGGPV